MIHKTLLLLCVLALPCSSWARAGELVVCNDVTDPLTLDPTKEFSQTNHTICQQIFEGLIRFGPAGNIEPALAVSWKQLDPLKVEFKLRKGVKFHNGEPFNSDAVKFAIDRYLNPKTGFPALPLISSIDHVDVVDDDTVNLVTKYPDGLLLNRLAAFVLMVPPVYIRQVGESEFAKHPIGTGAFRFMLWEQGVQIRLEANRHYWMGGYPKLDELAFVFIPKERQLAALFSGEVNLLFDVPGTQTLSVQSRGDTKVYKSKIFNTIAPALRFNRAPLSSRAVRRALNHALNKDALVRYDLMGNGAPISSLSMPGEMGHNSMLKPYPYNPAKAKKLLGEAGYPQGFSLNAMVKPNSLRTANIMAANFRDVGVTLNISTMSESQMHSYFSNPYFDLAIGDVPDTMAHAYFIQAIVIYSHSPFSLGKDENFDRSLEKMAMTVEEQERSRLARELDRYVYDEALSLFTYQRQQICGVRKGVDVASYVTGMPYFFAAEVHEGK